MKYARLVGVVVGAHAAIILGIAGVLLFPGCATVSEGPGEGKGVLYPPPNEPRQVDVPPVGPQVTTPVPQDPWKTDYHYKYPGEHGDLDIFSYGQDGTAGGEGEDSDVGNWN